MGKIIITVFVFIFISCEKESVCVGTDQVLRHKIFIECLEKVPKGPDATKYSDWAEVIDNCEECAYHQSRKVVPCDSVAYGLIKLAAESAGQPATPKVPH